MWTTSEPASLLNLQRSSAHLDEGGQVALVVPELVVVKVVDVGGHLGQGSGLVDPELVRVCEGVG